MHKSLLQIKRYGIIKTAHNKEAQIYNKPEGVVIGKIGNRNIIKINNVLWLFKEITFSYHYIKKIKK